MSAASTILFRFTRPDARPSYGRSLPEPPYFCAVRPGTRDGFGTIEELTEALKLIPVRTHFLPNTAAGHELITKRNAEEVPNMARVAFADMFGLIGDTIMKP